MGGSARFVMLSVAVLVVAGGLAPLRVHGAEPVPELDVVARTAVRVSPQHTQMVLWGLTDYARQCLTGLVSKSAPDYGEAPKDGAARFRLLIEHTASLKTPTPVHEVLLNGDFYSPFLVTQEKGAYRFRLTQWQESRYVNVAEWTSPYAVTHRFPLPKSYDSRDLAGLRENALMGASPKSIKQALLDRILPIRIGQSQGDVGRPQSCQVIVKNASRWPLKSLKAALEWPDARARGQARYTRYGATITLAQALAPGQHIVLPCTGTPLNRRFRWEYLEPMAIEASPVFAPAEGQ
ncbi:MAG: hypothetical protein AMS14_09520 [Planctomycetes bacterium DG_20]|nr:MAG: hypothetical protein AMS14_09520 [Planctomycetes bacterium DG_20]